jgi:hypothetical protein
MLAVLVAAGGCRPAVPFLVVENDSARPVRVTYVEHRAQGVGPPNAARRCVASSVAPVVLHTSELHLYLARGYTVPSAEVELDTASCTVRLEVGPGLSGAFQPSPFCADNAEAPATVARFEPTLDLLSIESATGRTEWHGWDTAAQFKRARRWCVLRITESQSDDAVLP